MLKSSYSNTIFIDTSKYATLNSLRSDFDLYLQEQEKQTKELFGIKKELQNITRKGANQNRDD